MEQVAVVNQEQTDAWDGVLFDRWVEFRELVIDGLGAHGKAAMELHPPHEGDRILDLGCGFGDSTRDLVAMAGTGSEGVGIDVSERFIVTANEEAKEAAATNVSFVADDIQTVELGGPFDYVYSRMGVMFFDNPVAAMRNVASAMAPGGRLCAIVWRRKLDNDWLHRAELVVEEYLEEPEESDEPTCGPGPFSMANADTVTEQLTIAGFRDISLNRCDEPIRIGNDLDHAVHFAMSLGPAGEVIRLVGEEEVEKVRAKIEADLHEAFDEWAGPNGVVAPASTWIIGARAPA